MHNILYWISVKEHLRVIEPIKEYPQFKQFVVIDKNIPTGGINIKNIHTYNNINDIYNIIDKINPDVFVQFSSSRSFANKIKEKNIRHVLSAHGVWPESNLNKKIVSDPFFNTFDLICGASNNIKKIFLENSQTKAKIVTNALTQFDLLFEQQKTFNDTKKIIGNGCNKIITLFGHNITQKTDKLRPYDSGFYETVDALYSLSKKNNWMVYVKTKTNKGKKLPKDNSNFKIIKHDSNPYQYFCSDVIITSARSTIEVEAALVNKPIIRIFMPTSILTQEQLSYEYGALDFGAVSLVKNLKDLESNIIKMFCENPVLENQKRFIEHLGISFDGMAHKRFLDAIRENLDE